MDDAAATAVEVEGNGESNEHLSVEQLLQQEVQQAADRTKQAFLSMNTVSDLDVAYLRDFMRI